MLTIPSLLTLATLAVPAFAAPGIERPLPMAPSSRSSIPRCKGNDLFAAIRAGDSDCLQKSFARMDPIERDAEGNSPLHLAIHLHRAPLIRLLLRHGADLHQRDFSGRTARELAEQYGYQRLARHLSEMERETERLWVAVEANDLAAATASLERGASLGTRDVRLDTPLHRAAQSNLDEMGRLLLKHGARLEARNYLGESPLHCAALRDHTDFLKMLLAAGANPNVMDERRRTPLDLSETRGNPEIRRMLARAGAKHGAAASVELEVSGGDGMVVTEGAGR